MATINEHVHDYLCRTCMHLHSGSHSYDASNKSDEQWQSIFDTIEECGTLQIAQLLSKTVPQLMEVQQTDELPKKICSKCLVKLLSVYQFQQLCLQTDQKMRALIAKRNAAVKNFPIEIPLDDEIDRKDLLAKKSVLVVNDRKMVFVPVNHSPETPEPTADPLQGIAGSVKSEPCERNESNVEYILEEFVDGPNVEYSETMHTMFSPKYEVLAADEGDEPARLPVLIEKTDQTLPKMVCDICEKSLCSAFSLRRHKRRYHSVENEKKPAPRLPFLKCSKDYANPKVLAIESDSDDRHNAVYSGDETGQSTLSAKKEVFIEEGVELLSPLVHECRKSDRPNAKTISCTKALNKSENINHFTCVSSDFQKRRTHNEKSDKTPKKHFCDICERKFCSAFSLKRHTRICHPIENLMESVIQGPHKISSRVDANDEVLTVDKGGILVVNEACNDDGLNVEYSGRETMPSKGSVKNEVFAVETEQEQVSLSHDIIDHYGANAKEAINQRPRDTSSRAAAISEMVAIQTDGNSFTNNPCDNDGSNVECGDDKKIHPAKPPKNDVLVVQTEVEQVSLPQHSEKIYKKIPQKCDICEKMFSSAYSLRRHAKRYHSTDKPKKPVRSDNGRPQKLRYKKIRKFCNICQKMLSSDYALERHTRRFHSAGNQYPCEFCAKICKSSKSLTIHTRKHIDERPYLCSECGKSFRQENLLKQHMFRHGNEKSFECPYCPLMFRCPNDVSKHKVIHEGIKRHVCDICGKGFSKSESLIFHKRYHNNEKPYQCECCKMRFHRLASLRRHRLTHTGEKPYKCKYCKRAFAQSNDHIKHLRSHLGENVYRCKLCPLAFRFASEMRLHFITHKNEDPETRERNLKALKETESKLQLKFGDVARVVP